MLIKKDSIMVKLSNSVYSNCHIVLNGKKIQKLLLGNNPFFCWFDSLLLNSS